MRLTRVGVFVCVCCNSRRTINVRFSFYRLFHATVAAAAAAEERWLCPNCGRHYKRKAHLSFHLAKECGVGPQYHCARCFKLFKRSSHLKSHQLSCGNVLPRFQCDICKKRFTRKDNMKTHRNTIHRRRAEQPLPNEAYAFYSEWHVGGTD